MQSNYQCLTLSGLDLNISLFIAEAAEAVCGSLAVITTWAGPAGLGHGNYFGPRNVQDYTCGNRRGSTASVSGGSRFLTPGAARRELDRDASCDVRHELTGARNSHEFLVTPLRQVS